MQHDESDRHAGLRLGPSSVRRPATRDVLRLVRSEQHGLPWETNSIGFAARLTTPTTRQRMTEILARMAARHAALRTAVVVDADLGTVLETWPAADSAALADAMLTWTSAPEDTDVTARLHALLERPYDLARPPLWRFEVLELASGGQVVLYGTHHAIADAATMLMVVRELGVELDGVELDAAPTDRDLELQIEAQTPRPGAVAPDEQSARFHGAARIELELTGPRPERRTYRGGSVNVDLPAGLVGRVASCASRLSVTRATVCLGAFSIMLARRYDRERFVLAVPVDTRAHVGAAGAFGYFGLPIPFPVHVSRGEPVVDVLRRTADELRRVREHGVSLVDTMPALIEAGLHREGAPLVGICFNFLRSPGDIPDSVELLPVRPAWTALDLMLTVLPDRDEVWIEYNADIIDDDTAEEFARDYFAALADIVDDTDAVALTPSAPPPAPVAIAATFALGDLPAMVSAAVEDGAPCVEAPYHQVHAALLDPAGAFVRGVGAGLVLIRGRDLDRFVTATVPRPEHSPDEWADAIRAAAVRTDAPLVVGFLPDREPDDRHRQWESRLADRLVGAPGIAVLGDDDWSGGGSGERFDTEADAAAHLPFTPEFQARVASAASQALDAVRRPVPKVIVVDGDETLWDGVAAETGAGSVGVDGPRAVLARQLLAWRAAGVLLVLLSNNDEGTVRAVLARTDSVLDADHFAVLATGWGPKPQRLAAAVAELGFALDTVLFLDDNPVEVAAVRAAYPETLAVTCPPSAEVEPFLRRLWPAPPRPVTGDDAARADRQRVELLREQELERTGFEEFLAGLELVVDVRQLVPETVTRSLQLARRTTQFALRPAPSDEDALLHAQRAGEVWTATASDRFGDYGLVGLVVLRPLADVLEVVAWSLSCRALGRGVEEEILHRLADRADELGLSAVRLTADRTERNVPARRLVAALDGGDVEAARLVAEVAPARLRALRPGSGALWGPDVPAPTPRVATGSTDRRAEAERIDAGGRGPGAAAELLGRFRSATAPTSGAPADSVPAVPDPAVTDPDRLAEAVATTAARLLGVPSLDVGTDFFDAGGSSVQAVELVGALSRELGMRLGLDDVFADARPRRLAQRWMTATGVVVPAAPVAVRSAATVASDDDGDELSMITADLARADALPWVHLPVPSPPDRFLITGTTGFLGAHMLLDLLRHSDADAVCLVRGRDDEDAEQRLVAALRSFDVPWSAEVRRRVTVVAGDLRAPRLGLSDDRWHALTADVDSVVSVGAAVDFLRGYPSLRRTNVHGPITLAEFAMTGRPKPLHHVSSIAVFNEIGVESMGEDDPVAHVDRLEAGYDKTKWAAEAALRRAREHGLVATFLRPGGIAGHTVTGAYNPQDLSSGLLAAFSRFRTVPAFRHFNVAAVDWVSRIATAVVLDPEAWGTNYHLVGRANSMSELVRDMELGGMNLTVMDWAEWRADVLARLEADPEPKLDFFARSMQNPGAVALVEAQLDAPAAAAERTHAFVASRNLPPATRYDAVAGLRNFERMARDGLVRLPRREDPPYLWFPETMKGRLHTLDPAGEPVGDRTAATMRLTLSIASMYQLSEHRTIHARGELRCPLLHGEPVTVETGDIWVRPDGGVPLRHGTVHPLLRYRLVLRDADGARWWLEGWKFSRAHHNWWKQGRRLYVEIGREGAPATIGGRLTVPGKTYVKEQIDGIRADPRLSVREQRVAKLTWLTWFGMQMGQGLIDPSLRLAADLLDLRRDAVDHDRERVRDRVKKLVKAREEWE